MTGGGLEVTVSFNNTYIVKNSKVSMYADDTSIYHSCKDIMHLNMALNEVLWRLDRWLQENKRSLNVAKTCSTSITMKQKKKHLTTSNQALKPSIREEHIEVICNSKYLGVQIDENLTWMNQIKSVTEKASRAIGFLKYAKHFLPESIVKTHTSIVKPHFQYCCSVGAVAIPLTSYNCRGSKTEQHAS